MKVAFDFRELTPLQLDALKEIGNIGAGNAATALSKMLSRRVEMSVPVVRILPFAEVPASLGGEEVLIAGILFEISGSAPGKLLFALPFASAGKLVHLLLGRAPQAPRELGELESSALKETANILAGSFLSALASFTSLSFLPSVPALCVDMAAALLGVVFSSLGRTGDSALYVETLFRCGAEEVVGYLFFIPEASSLEAILEALGVSR